MEAWREELYNGLEIYHHGIKGQKWGVRRYQNPDGTLTSLGRDHLNLEKRLIKNANQRAKERSGSKAGVNSKNRADLLKARRTYKDNESLGNKIVKTLLLGPIGTYSYNSNRAAGSSRLGAAIGRPILADLKTLPITILGGLSSVVTGPIGPAAALAVNMKVREIDAGKRYAKLSDKEKKELNKRITR